MRCSCPEQMLPDLPLHERLATIAGLGFEGVDARASTLLDPAWTAALATSGLSLASVYSQIRTPSLLDASARDRATAVDDVVNRATLTAEHGAANMIIVPVFGGPRFVIDAADTTRAAEIGVFLAALREIAERIVDLPVTLVLEPLNRKETHLLVEPIEAADWCRAIGSERIMTMVDTYHCGEEGIDPAARCREIADRLQLVHFSDTARGLPGEGSIAFPDVVAALEALGYHGWIGWECRTMANAEDREALARSLTHIRDLMTVSTVKEA